MPCPTDQQAGSPAVKVEYRAFYAGVSLLGAWQVLTPPSPARTEAPRSVADGVRWRGKPKPPRKESPRLRVRDEQEINIEPESDIHFGRGLRAAEQAYVFDGGRDRPLYRANCNID